MFCPDPVAFTIFGRDIYWYGILISLSVVLAVIMVYREAKREGLDADCMLDYALLTVPIAIVCARIYYVIFEWDQYAADPIRALYIWEGGIAIYGAVIGGVIATLIFSRWKKISFWKLADLVAPGLVLGQAIGRWGNFFNQEAFGTNTNSLFGMYSQGTHDYLARWQSQLAAEGVMVDPSMPVHPTFLYESVWCFVGFFALWAFMKKRRFNGQIALLYAVWYGAGRFWIEGLRTDSLLIPGLGLRVSQVVALACVVVGLVLLVVLGKKYKNVPFEVQLAVSGDTLKQAKAAGLTDEQVASIAGKLPVGASHAAFAAQTAQIAQTNWEARAAALAQTAPAEEAAPAEETAPAAEQQETAEE